MQRGKQQAEKMQSITAEGEAGLGLVRIVLRGIGEPVKVEISKEIVDDLVAVEDLVVTAQNHAFSNLMDEAFEPFKDMLPPGTRLPL